MTRTAQVRIISKDQEQEIWLYRVVGGDPERILSSLRLIRRWLEHKQIPADVSECATWLMYLGMREYSMLTDEDLTKRDLNQLSPILPETNRSRRAWRIGAYEPCASQILIEDIDWFYEFDVKKATIQIGRPEIMIDSWCITHLLQDDEQIPINQINEIIHQQIENFDALPKMMCSEDGRRKKGKPIFLYARKEVILWNSNLTAKHLTN